MGYVYAPDDAERTNPWHSSPDDWANIHQCHFPRTSLAGVSAAHEKFVQDLGPRITSSFLVERADWSALHAKQREAAELRVSAMANKGTCDTAAVVTLGKLIDWEDVRIQRFSERVSTSWKTSMWSLY